MAKKAQPSLQAADAFTIQPSDTDNIVEDSNNVEEYTFCYVHNPSAGGTVRVLPADAPNDDARAVTIYIPQGGTSQIMVKRVYLTTPAPPASLVAYIGRGGSF